jgi:hypothetical protein
MIKKYNIRMPKASKVYRFGAIHVSSTTPTGSNNNAHKYFYKPAIPSGLINIC